MAVTNPIYTQNLSVDPVTFTDVEAPGSYDRVCVLSPGSTSIFARGGAGQAEVEIGAGNAYVFGDPVTRNDRAFERQFGAGNTRQVRLTRFVAGDVVCQVRSGSGTGPAKLVWS